MTLSGTRNKSPMTLVILFVVVALLIAVGVAGFFLLPMLLSGPHIVQLSPADGLTNANPQEPIRIEFDQWVRVESVADALSFDPPVPFTLQASRATVLVQPEGGLRYGTRYRITIAPTVKNLVGRSLDQPLESAFTTVPYINVASMQPADGTGDVRLTAPVLVTFEQPVVSANDIAAAAETPQVADTLPQPVTLKAEPGGTVAGVGRWLSPTLFGFYPGAGLRPATTYVATINPGLSANGQLQLEKPLTWTFTTDAVQQVTMIPTDGATDVAVDSTIAVRLPVDVASSADTPILTLHEVGSKKEIAVSVQHVSGGGMVFQPATPLQRGVQYQVRMPDTLRTSEGTQIEPSPRTWAFTTIGNLEVEQVEPRPDSNEVALETSRISMRFNHPVVPLTTMDAQATLPTPLLITPTLRGKGQWIDTRTYVFSPTQQLDAATTYHARVPAGLEDQTGGTLQQTYTWSFVTERPQVVRTIPAADEEYANPDDAINVVFNQPMDPVSLEDTLQLWHVATDQVVQRTIVVDGAVATITPTQSLRRGTDYLIFVSEEAKVAQGEATMGEDTSITFSTAPLPALKESQPKNGARAADPSGSISLTFSAPMDWDTVSVSIDPQPSNAYTSTDETHYYIYTSLEGETAYDVTIDGSAQDIYGETMGDDASVSFTTDALPPSLSLIGGYQVGTYNAYANTRIPLRHINISDVTYRIYRLEPETAARLLGDYSTWDAFQTDPSNLVKEKTVELDADNNREAVTILEAGNLDAGLYYLDVTDATERGTRTDEEEPTPDKTTIYGDHQVMIVTPYALTIKNSADKLLVWAVDLKTGQPAANLPIQVAYGSYTEDGFDLSQQDAGQTDNDGILQTTPPAQESYGSLYVWSTEADRVAFASSGWDDGISPWSFDVEASYQTLTSVGNVSTDRPIYRPGQIVSIRGAVRTVQGDAYQPPQDGQQVRISVNDPQWNTMFSTVVTVGEFGTFATNLTLDQSAAPGSYTIYLSNVETDQQDSGFAYGSFTVAEYRKPAFEVAVVPSKPDLVQDESLTMDVTARYYSGGVVADAPVRWRLLSAPLVFQSESVATFRFDALDDPYAWYRGDEGTQGSALVSEGTAITDHRGKLSLHFPTALGEDQQSRVLTLDVEVTDVDGQVIAAQGKANIHTGEFYIGMRPDGYVADVGKPQSVSLITVDPQGQMVADRALAVSIYKREWYSVRERGADGQMYWTSAYSETLVDTMDARTDAQGRAAITFIPNDGGSYRIGAEGRDSQGHTVRSSAFTWAYGGAIFWGINDKNRIDLIADKDRYQPGDTARILVPAPYTGMTALMTIERSGIIEHRVLTLKDTSELIQVPITADYAPNVYVSLVLIKPALDELPVPDVRVGLINLPVSAEQKELRVAVTPDREQAGPGDDVTYTIQATDYTGAGVRAEVSLALVDKAVLALMDDPNPTLFQTFYEERPLGVFTSQSLTTLVDRVTIDLNAKAKGGGGGMASDVLLRQDFQDTAYWNPAVVTGDDGTAQVTVKLPDNLTTWEMTARGLTIDTLVGQSSNDLLTTRPLLVRPSLPRFLTVGDQPTIQAVLHNTTDSAIDATVTLELSGLNSSTPTTQQVTVPAQGETLVTWQAEVPPTSTAEGEAVLRFTVEGGGLQDAVSQRLPIQRFVTPEVVASAGQVFDTPVVETIALAGATRDMGEIDLELLPSLSSGIDGGLDYLETYPYGCTEQTVSRFLPNAVTYRLLAQAHIDNETLKTNLERNLSQGLQRLSALQHPDGGWGWWEDDATNPYITAYVMQGLLETGKAGYRVDTQMLDNAVSYLQYALDEGSDTGTSERNDDTAQPIMTGDVRSYILFVLSEAGMPDRGRTIALYERRNTLSLYGKAYLLMTLHAIGGEVERVHTLVDDLTGRALLHPTDAHWEEQTNDAATMSSDTRTTALVLQALVRTDPSSMLVPNAVRYLMGLREQGHWRTTQETAMSLLAISEYLASTGELEANYTYRATLDSRVLSEGTIDPDHVQDPISLVVSLAELATQEPSATGMQTPTLAMEKQGTGRLYYTLRLRSYQDAASVQALDQGIQLQRDYLAVDPATLLPTGTRVSSAQVGDVVQVYLTITVPETMHYLAIEDMLPAGLDVLDSSLKTVSSLVDEPELAEAESTHPYWWYFVQTEIHDNRVALFATELPAGTYTYTYLARATIPGTYQVLPTTAFQMYAPEVSGRGAGEQFVVTAVGQ